MLQNCLSDIDLDVDIDCKDYVMKTAFEQQLPFPFLQMRLNFDNRKTYFLMWSAMPTLAILAVAYVTQQLVKIY